MERMPWSVRAAAAAVAAVMLVLAGLLAFLGRQGQAPWGQGAVVLAAVGLLLTGLLRRWRLAWLWGRFLGFFLSALVLLSAWSAWRGDASPWLLAVPVLGLVLPLLALGVALGRPSAAGYFGLTCPACGAVGGTPADLRFQRVRCGRCRAIY